MVGFQWFIQLFNKDGWQSPPLQKNAENTNLVILAVEEAQTTQALKKFKEP